MATVWSVGTLSFDLKIPYVQLESINIQATSKTLGRLTNSLGFKEICCLLAHNYTNRQDYRQTSPWNYNIFFSLLVASVS